jgi:hypothetical protein
MDFEPNDLEFENFFVIFLLDEAMAAVVFMPSSMYHYRSQW